MGYNGKIESAKRNRAVMIDEATRVLQAGLEMLDFMNEIKDGSEDINLKNLNIRIGVHTGQVIAGLIGSKIVKYDIFGEGVLTANKLKMNAMDNKVCISGNTRDLLADSPEIANDYYYHEFSDMYIPSYKKQVRIYQIERKKQESFDQNISSEIEESMDSDMYTVMDQEEGETSRSHTSNNSLVKGKPVVN